MNINKLFENLQEDTFDELLEGELCLEGNCIVWSYNLKDVTEDIPTNMSDEDEEDELDFEFNVTSPEELLQEAYNKDFILIENRIAELDEFIDWSYSEPEVIDLTISFKIF